MIQNFKKLIKKFKEDKDFQKRNISELIKIIPYVGGLIEANVFGNEREKELDEKLLVLENIAKKAVVKEDLSQIIDVIEQHSLVLNKFVFDNLEKIQPPSELEKIKIGISFVKQDINVATKITKQLKENQIDIFSNDIVFSKENNISYSKILPNSIDSLIVIYSDNYEKYNSSSYNNDTYLNKANKYNIPITTIAFDEIINSNLQLTNNFKKVFKSDEASEIINNFFFDNYIQIKEQEQNLIKRYSDVGTILKLHNKTFNLLESFSKNKIGFELYESKLLTNTSIYCVYLYENINIKSTIEYIKSNLLTKNEDFFILVQKKRFDQNKRYNYIKSLVNESTNIYFIDEFVWENLTSNYFDKTQVFKNRSFIPPNLLYQKNKFDNFNFFDNWLYKKNSPILVITGSGGIGKTTLAKELTQRINSAENNTRALYIDALRISSSILHLTHNNNNIDLYSFYESSLSNEEKESLSYDLFRINIDNGNIVIIIDGLDEIISRLGDRFDITDFYNSIQDFTNGIGNGKVILTSRNHFWDSAKSLLFDSLEIEILPFDKIKAKEYFENIYPNSERLVTKAMNIADSILGDISNNDFIPYVLECVSFIIEDSVDNEGEYYDPDFDSETLKQNIKNDFILGKLCVRETERTEQIEVDKQLEVFFEIANSSLSINEFKNVCKRLKNVEINDRQIETFLSHPIINSKNEIIKFKYDFFKNHIKSIFLNNFISNTNHTLDNNHIDILQNLVSFNSSFTSDLIERLTLNREELVFRLLEIQEAIKTSQELSIDSVRKSISSLFIILLKHSANKKKNNTETNTANLVDFFGVTDNKIDSMFILDLSSNSSNKIIFDFSDLIISDSFISSYDYFWECKFNINTKFNDSYFYKVHKTKNLNTTATKQNFTNVKGSDESFKKVIDQTVQKKKNIDSKIISDLHNFFSRFCSNGLVERKIYPKINQLYQRKYLKLDTLLKILEKENIINTYSSPKNIKTIEINSKYHADILKFQSNRISVGIVKKLFNLIKENYT